MKKRLPTCIAAAWMFSACVNSTAEVSKRPESEEISDVQHQLSVRLEEKFGKGARVQQIFGRGEQVLIGVAKEELVGESDSRPPLAVASYDTKQDLLEVVSEQTDFREARLLPSALALVTMQGELKLRRPDGTEKVIAANVRGDVTAAPNGAILATLEGGSKPLGDSAVLLADEAGQAKVIADGEGVDDRGSVSPDGKTVLFVSGRSGIASLWRTTLEGGEPVQITNQHIEAGVERTGEPEGFVPPPVMGDRLDWISEDVVEYDAGEGDLWQVNVRTGEATHLGGAK